MDRIRLINIIATLKTQIPDKINGMNKSISFLKFFIGWPLALIAIGFLINLILPKLSTIMDNLININIFLIILSIILFIIYFLLRSFLWQKILEYKGFRINYIKSTYLWGFSEFKRYIPGNIWSFLSRVSLFSNEGLDKKTSSLALLDEIQLIVVSCTLISLTSVPFMLSIGNDDAFNQMRYILSASTIGVVIYCLVVAYIFKKRVKESSFLGNLLLPGISIIKKIKLLFYSLLTFIVFGIATLTACISFYPFSLELYIPLASFFVFTLLAGYLSFITPVGLGVREGIITVGLSSLIGVATASFLGIFSRIVLIISELLFLFVSLMLHKLTSKNS